jgi:hypothetical protein
MSLKNNEVCRSQITALNSVLKVKMCFFALLVLLIAKINELDKYMPRRNINICVNFDVFYRALLGYA